MNNKIFVIAIIFALILAACVGCSTDVKETGESEQTKNSEHFAENSELEDKNTDAAPSEDSDTDGDTREDFRVMTFEEYNALSGEEQKRYFDQFEDLDSFFEWYNAAKKEYEDKVHSSDIIIGGSETLDFDGIFGGGN